MSVGPGHERLDDQLQNEPGARGTRDASPGPSGSGPAGSRPAGSGARAGAAPEASPLPRLHRARLEQRLATIALAVGIAGVAGVLYGLVLASVTGQGDHLRSALQGLLSGLLIASVCAGADVLVLSNPRFQRIRALPFALFVSIRAAIYAAGIFMGLRVPALIVRGPDAMPDWTFSNPVFTQSFLISMGIALFVALSIEISRLLGPGILPALLTGRYHRPRREERVFLFADIEGSTALAERIGDLEFHRLLAAVFADFAEPVIAARGQTYRYVGDEIIVTWPVKRGVARSRCLACIFDMKASLAARADWYAAEFGHVPRFRAALHCGPVVTGEMGDQRKEIVFLGDTVNTASRLQSECSARGEELLLSGRLVDLLPKDPRFRLRSLGEWLPRGKTQPIRLYAADPAGADAAGAAAAAAPILPAGAELPGAPRPEDGVLRAPQT
ncbi:adenylate/guanylate cyclase domain-containing protein [Rhodovulum sp. DZ06]|uniref:adenylate/guanylate cyclase domain-containing protein n=1 Tax=Rhodovulum sp. DZ06 TaxID=3425126 RepID=UPI003D34384C